MVEIREEYKRIASERAVLGIMQKYGIISQEDYIIWMDGLWLLEAWLGTTSGI